MPVRTVSRGELYFLDRDKVARLSPINALGPPPVGTADPRMDRSHPVLLVQSEYLSGQKRLTVGLMVTTADSQRTLDEGASPWNTLLQPSEVTVDAPADGGRVRLVKGRQIYTFDSDLFSRRLGIVVPAAMSRVNEALAAVLGLRD